jgi:hypothetical protein
MQYINFTRAAAAALKKEVLRLVLLSIPIESFHLYASSLISLISLPSYSCVYRFEAQRGERVKIVVHRMMAGNRTCETRVENDTQRSFCYGDNTAKVQIYERPWHDSEIFVRSCVCNSTTYSTLPITYVSNSRELEVHFSAINMTRLDDPDSLNFQATFEFVRPSAPTKCKDARRKLGSEGVINLNEAEVRGRTTAVQ